MHNNTSSARLATIGSGASVIYLVKHMADHLSQLDMPWQEWHIYERDSIVGMGMPYNPHTTDRYNLANITSEELPPLRISFAAWLKTLPDADLKEFDITRAAIGEKEIYSRLALGQYLHAQFNSMIEEVRQMGLEVVLYPNTEVEDVALAADGQSVSLHLAGGVKQAFDQVIISTGHQWAEEDEPDGGYFASPWPIAKLLPEAGAHHHYPIGMLGASLSAFDVATAIAHRHGRFNRVGGGLRYTLHPEAKGLLMVMHSDTGWLPQLQYEQKEPYRKIYRYTDRDGILALRSSDGYMSMADFFHTICRPVLRAALAANGFAREAKALSEAVFGFADFVEMMGARHEYHNPFEGMRVDLPVAEESVEEEKPIFWKEAFDDLMYTLNFHMELLPAEDHLFYHATVKPFLMNVIAALPLRSAKILLALYDAGVLSLVKGKVGEVQPGPDGVKVPVETDEGKRTEQYKIFVGCGGDKPIVLSTYPFPTLVQQGAVRAGRAAFASANGRDVDVAPDRLIRKGDKQYLNTGGIAVDAGYAVVNEQGKASGRIFDLTFTHVAGQRPYSYGLQACDATAAIFVRSLASRLSKRSSPPLPLPEVMKMYSDAT